MRKRPGQKVKTLIGIPDDGDPMQMNKPFFQPK